MPDNSMFTSRKSAESLAKLLYRIAHNEEAKQIDFCDILNDTVVRKYVNNPSVINAFHFIRKKGNEAVHTMTDANQDMLWSVTACGIVILLLPAIVKLLLEIVLHISGPQLKIMAW